MSAEASTVSIANKGKASVWTEEAKYELLLRVIHQLKQGKAIRWSAINMKDRNAKSISNIWTKIGKDIAQLEDLEESGGENTPQSQKSGSAKRKSPVKLEAEDNEAPETPVKKKRGRPAAVKKDITPVKKEQTGSDAEY